eukprot:7812873-Pyramimonas_sp.AAC.1
MMTIGALDGNINVGGASTDQGYEHENEDGTYKGQQRQMQRQGQNHRRTRVFYMRLQAAPQQIVRPRAISIRT